MKKGLLILTSVALLMALMAGCGQESEEVTAKDKDALTIAIQSDIATLDPQNSASANDAAIYRNLYNALVREDNGVFMPDLAESWEVSEDGLTWTFHLKQGVLFHNGEELKASDVVFSMNRAKQSPYIALAVAYLDSAKAIDDYTVEVVAYQKYAPFLLTVGETVKILNEKAVEEAGDTYGENPVGTGPYKFVSHTTGQNIILERFDDYFNGVVPIKTVTYQVISDPNTALIALETNEVDMCNYIPAISAESVEENPDLAIYKNDSISLNYLQFNVLSAPFDDVNFRKAVNHGIDKEGLIQIVLEGAGTPATGIWNELTFGYSDKIQGYGFDDEKAKELVEQSSYDGSELTLITGQVAENGATIIQENLKNIGINVKIEIQEGNSMIQNIATGNYDMAFTGIVLIPDADAWKLCFHSTQMIPSIGVVGYANEEIDRLFDEGATELDYTKRLAIYEELSTILEEDAVIVPLFFNTTNYALDKDLKIDRLYYNGYNLEDVSWESN